MINCRIQSFQDHKSSSEGPKLGCSIWMRCKKFWHFSDLMTERDEFLVSSFKQFQINSKQSVSSLRSRSRSHRNKRISLTAKGLVFGLTFCQQKLGLVTWPDEQIWVSGEASFTQKALYTGLSRPSCQYVNSERGYWHLGPSLIILVKSFTLHCCLTWF